MTLATFADGNRHLDGTKIQFRNDEDALPEATSADAVVKGALLEVFPDHANLWDTNPETGEEPTPELVREITGLLMAAYRYQSKYSEETVDPTSYGVMLETRAMTLLEGLRAGTLVLSDVDYTASTAPSSGDVFPNDRYVVTADNPQPGLDIGDPDIKFSMDKVF